jgi:DNA-directed RNA polymerase specialized sigma24 family protein
MQENGASSPIRDELKSDHFENFLQRLDPDRGRAGEKYEELRRRLIKFFEWNSCFPAEDLVDETFDRVTEKLDDVPVLDVAGFAWGIAKHIRQEAHKRAERVVQISDLPAGTEFLAQGKSPEKAVQEEMEDEQRTRCLRLCLQRFSPPERALFLDYHKSLEEQTEYRRQLATGRGLTLGALRVRINRLRQKLEECVQRCMAGRRREQKP